ncbi:MAG: hypothetical protein ACOC1K_02585 [Nanoarchaeota archaeon]
MDKIMVYMPISFYKEGYVVRKVPDGVKHTIKYSFGYYDIDNKYIPIKLNKDCCVLIDYKNSINVVPITKKMYCELTFEEIDELFYECG